MGMGLGADPKVGGKSWLGSPIFAALISLCVAMAVALVLLTQFAARQADAEAERQGTRLGTSVEVILTPLMLADDRVSMNFIANQLVNDPTLSGLKVTDENNLTQAIAGSPSSVMITRQVAPNDDPLGEITLWIDPVPALSSLQQQLMLVLAGFLTSLGLSALVYHFLRSRSVVSDTQAVPAERPFSETLQDELEGRLPEDSLSAFDSGTANTDKADDELQRQSADQETSDSDLEVRNGGEDLDTIDPLDPAHEQLEPESSGTTFDQTPEQTSEEYSDPRFDQTRYQTLDQQQHQDSELAEEDSDAKISLDDIDLETEEALVKSNLESWLKNDDDPDDALNVHQTLQKPEPESVPVLKSFAPEPRTDDPDGDVDLIELLRPEPSADQSMPPFKPAPISAEDEALVPDTEEIQIDIPVPVSTPATKARKLPIITEEQLDLYTLEQELDLLLAAKDAGYLIFIDTTSAHSGHVETEEARQIRRTYRTLANSVARIYHGTVQSIGEDLEIRFDQPDERDAHGMNAVCAALLFNILYRSYNQSRIKQMAPVLNLHIAVVRGQVQRFSQLFDEARFLTRSTQTNHLISHTALTEAPDLKAGLLDQADLKREDEDKVLILKVEKRHQTLLEKQARYLLAKLAERAASQG